MKKEAYKVVKVIKNNDIEEFYSCTITEEEFKLRYKLNEITNALPFTMGVFCFRELKQAKEFLDYLKLKDYYEDIYCILKVKPLSQGKEFHECFMLGSTSLNYFYNTCQDISELMSTPKGTVCYNSVIVLEKVI